MIGGADMYQAVCRDCFKSPMKKSPRQSPYKMKENSPRKTKSSPRQKGSKLSPLRKAEDTPEALAEMTVTQLQNYTNRKLFLETPPRS